MDQQTQNYFENFYSMLASDGWKQLISELENEGKQIMSVELYKTIEDVFFVKGQLSIIARLMNLEAALEAAAKSQENSNESPE